MNRSRAAFAVPSDRLLRILGDPRLALGLLLLAGAANAAAAALPEGPRLLDHPLYAALLGVIVLSGMAAVGVRAPAAWREWRRPGPLVEGDDRLVARIPFRGPLDEPQRAAISSALRRAGYRVAAAGGRRWALHGVRRGWTRFAALGSHLALVVLLVGVAASAAFGRETTFSLLPGDQALLDAPRAGFTDAVRLERFDAEFGPDGRPRRLDTVVTFLRDGEPVEPSTLQANRPGAFGGYLVHAWTYGPAVELRVTSLAGRTLLDAPVALDAELSGSPAALIEVPAAGATLGLLLTDAAANQLTVTVAGTGGVADAVRLRPGEDARVGELLVRLHRFSAYVTFLSRRDPGTPLVFAGGGLLTVTLAAAFWLPRRRVSLLVDDGGIELRLRGEHFDRPVGELERLRRATAEALQ